MTGDNSGGATSPPTGKPAHPIADHPPGAPATQPAHWTPPRKSPWVVAGIIVLAVLAIAAIAAAFQLPPFDRNPDTDDAYIRGHTTVIAPQVSGYVAKVLVDDYRWVRAGDELVEIDDSTYRAKVEQARAALELQRAQLSNNDQALASAQAALGGKVAALSSAQVQHQRNADDLKRDEALVDDGSVSIRERDQQRAAYQQAVAALRQAEADVRIARENIRTIEVQRDALNAQVAGAQSQLDAANIDLSHTVIHAPESGQLSEVGVRVGQFVTNGTQLFSLVPATRWVIANYKEAQTQHMRVGQPASFRVDALGGVRFDGFVERISPATGSEFEVIKPDNATGNFVKVPQRIGVRIGIKSDQSMVDQLRPGMSVEAVVQVDATPVKTPSDDRGHGNSTAPP
jgi:multidrug resistance efflux pump